MILLLVLMESLMPSKLQSDNLQAKTQEAQKTLADEQAKLQAMIQAFGCCFQPGKKRC